MKKRVRLEGFHSPSLQALRSGSVPPESGSLVLASATDLVTTAAADQPASVGPVSIDASRRMPTFPMLATRAIRGTVPRQLAVLPQQQRFLMTLDFSRAEVRLPFGVPRFVNGATLRAMAGGRPLDQLLKKVGDVWEFVEDDTMIDLTNGSEQFRLGRLTIFS